MYVISVPTLPKKPLAGLQHWPLTQRYTSPLAARHPPSPSLGFLVSQSGRLDFWDFCHHGTRTFYGPGQDQAANCHFLQKDHLEVLASDRGDSAYRGGPVGHVTATPEERLAWSCRGWGHPDHSDSEESFLPQSGRCGTRDPVEGVLGVPGGGPGCHFPPLSEVSFPGFTAPLCSPPRSLPCTALIQHNVSGCWGQGQRVAFQEAPS